MIDRTVRAVGSQRRQWLVIAGCGAIPIAVALALVPLGYPLDGAGVQIAVYSSGYLIAGSIAWLRRPDNPVGPVMLATAVAISLSFLLLHPDPAVRRLAGLCASDPPRGRAVDP